MELKDDYLQLNSSEKISYSDIVRVIKRRDYSGYCHMSIFGNGKGWHFDFNAGTNWQAIDTLARDIQAHAGDHQIIIESHDGVKAGWIGWGVGIGVFLLLCAFAALSSTCSSRSNYGSNTRTATCQVCGRSFEAGDSDGNFKNIARTHMCNNCYANYQWGQKAIGNEV